VKKLLRVFLSMGLVALMAGPSLAGLGVDFTGVTTDFTNGNWSLGWSFTTNGPVTITKLGFYDAGQDGLAQDHAVGIYDSSGNLLVSTTVLTTDPLTSWFRFHDITPLTLAGSETYYIQAVTGSENYTYFTTGFTVDPSINFIQDAWVLGAGGALAFPDSTAGITQADGGAYFGPNFDSTPVPVPPTLLLLASGLLGLGGWRKFRKN
jgi:hypothetical protein